MIPEPRHSHRAILDQSGNIIIPDALSVPDIRKVQPPVIAENSEKQCDAQKERPELLEASADDESPFDPWLSTSFEESVDPRSIVRERINTLFQDLVKEGTKQFVVSARESVTLSRDTAQASATLLTSLWQYLSQPVRIPGRDLQPKRYGRGVLFLLDTVRFGGTFALLFSVLFGALNYQSFWAIAQSYVEPLATIAAPSHLATELGTASKNSAAISTLTTNAGSYDILQVLPSIGPPEHRIVIPTLDLNVPIVIPSRASLLAEDWKQLEEEIQKGLQNGVVHYPGTAEPGQPGNFFITGHSSYFPWAPGNFKSVFARLHELNVGDEYWVYYGGDRYRYVIQEKKEIRPSDVTVLDQPVNKRIGTLMTCTPVGTTLRRLILVSQEIDPVTGEPLDAGEHQRMHVTPKLRMDMLPI